MTDYLIEACVDTVSGAIAAQRGGARRIELCADLDSGGLTPSAGAIQLALQQVSIPLHIMIRPRAGDFVYDTFDLEQMAVDVRYAKELGAAGVVFGILTPDATIDGDATARLIRLARPLSVTFHRAFDLTVDPHAALDTLIALGVDRLLTSGQEATASAGSRCIAELIQHAAGRLVIMPGSGITPSNIAEIAQTTGARELHLSGRARVESPMRQHNPRVHMGRDPLSSDTTRQATSAAIIAACVQALTHHHRD